jgi:predicted oxidoreductase
MSSDIDPLREAKALKDVTYSHGWFCLEQAIFANALCGQEKKKDWRGKERKKSYYGKKSDRK